MSIEENRLYCPNEYYLKNEEKAIDLTLNLSNNQFIQKKEGKAKITRKGLSLSKNAFFGRPSMRIVPTLTNVFVPFSSITTPTTLKRFSDSEPSRCMKINVRYISRKALVINIL